MAILHVRSVPDELYEELRNLAEAKQRSLSAQVVALLQAGVEEEKIRQEQGVVLEAIRRRRFSPPANAPDSTTLLRQDRER